MRWPLSNRNKDEGDTCVRPPRSTCYYARIATGGPLCLVKSSMSRCQQLRSRIPALPPFAARDRAQQLQIGRKGLAVYWRWSKAPNAGGGDLRPLLRATATNDEILAGLRGVWIARTEPLLERTLGGPAVGRRLLARLPSRDRNNQSGWLTSRSGRFETHDRLRTCTHAITNGDCHGIGVPSTCSGKSKPPRAKQEGQPRIIERSPEDLKAAKKTAPK